MRILFVHHSPYGSQGKAAHRFYPENLARYHEFEVGVLCPGGRPQLICNSLIDKLTFFNNPEKGFLYKAINLKKVIHQFSPQIVHVFFARGVGIFPLLNSQTYFILDIRSPLLALGIRRIVAKLIGPLEGLFYDRIFSHHISCGETVIGTKKTILPAPIGVQIETIHSKSPSMARADNQPLRLVYCGAIHRKRNLDILIQGLIKADKHIKFTMDFFGYGDDVQRLSALVNHFGLTHRIRFMGHVEFETLGKCLQNYDIGISFIPTELYDLAPSLKTLEYMAAGLPVLATNTRGNSRLIKDGINGYCVFCTSDGVKEGLLKFWHLTKEEYIRIIENNRFLAEKYSWKYIVSDFLVPVYRQLES